MKPVKEANRVQDHLDEFLADESTKGLEGEEYFARVAKKMNLNETEIASLERVMGLGVVEMKLGMVTPRTFLTAVVDIAYSIGRSEGLKDA